MSPGLEAVDPKVGVTCMFGALACRAGFWRRSLDQSGI